MNHFPLFSLPPEIQYEVLDSCSNRTLATALSVSHRINFLVKLVMANRMSKVCGLPTSSNCNASKSESATGQILLRAYSPEDLSQASAHWFDTEYVETNNRCEFNYAFNSPYSSSPSTAFNSEDDEENQDSDTDMKASTPQSAQGKSSKHLDKCFKVDLQPQSKFRIKSHLRTSVSGMRNAGNSQTVQYAHPLARRQQFASRNAQQDVPTHDHDPAFGMNHNQIAKIDIVEGDDFGQVVLQVSMSLGRSQQVPVLLFQKTQRVYAEWTHNDEYLIHNKEMTCRIQVTQANRELRTNDFGEKYRSYEVMVQELVFNTGFLLEQIEKRVPIQHEMVQYRVSHGQ